MRRQKRIEFQTIKSLYKFLWDAEQDEVSITSRSTIFEKKFLKNFVFRNIFCIFADVMANYKYKEKDGIVNVMDGDNVIAKYEVDRHWTEKNVSFKDSETLRIRLYNRMKGFLDCEVKLNVEDLQKIPEK